MFSSSFLFVFLFQVTEILHTTLQFSFVHTHQEIVVKPDVILLFGIQFVLSSSPGAVFLMNHQLGQDATGGREVKSPKGRLTPREALWPIHCYNDMKYMVDCSSIVRND